MSSSQGNGAQYGTSLQMGTTSNLDRSPTIKILRYLRVYGSSYEKFSTPERSRTIVFATQPKTQTTLSAQGFFPSGQPLIHSSRSRLCSLIVRSIISCAPGVIFNLSKLLQLIAALVSGRRRRRRRLELTLTLRFMCWCGSPLLDTLHEISSSIVLLRGKAWTHGEGNQHAFPIPIVLISCISLVL